MLMSLSRGVDEFVLIRIIYAAGIAIFASFLIAFIGSYFIVKAGRDGGEVTEESMFMKDGKLSINFFNAHE